MSKSVSKYCSILNYIRHTDEELHELVQDLCIGRIFNPRKGSPGITFLRPDKGLLSKIKKMAIGDNPEDAVAAIQSLVLLDYLPQPSDFGEKKNNIPTALRKKLPVLSADNKKVILSNNAEIVLDKDFAPRNAANPNDNRSNLAVYIISKELVPTDTEVADLSEVKFAPRAVKGAAEFGTSRAELFEKVVRAYCGANARERDPALEVLVSLLRWCEHGRTPEKDSIAGLVASQVSKDTLASLAIILQPYRDSNKPMYISDSEFKEWSNACSISDSPLFCYEPTPVAFYESQLKLFNVAPYKNAITSIQVELAQNMSKITAVKKIREAQMKILTDIMQVVCPKRYNVAQASQNLPLCESELRVLSALIHEQSYGKPDVNDLLDFYRNKCNLNSPYICAEKEAINNGTIGFYYSTIYLMARSNALLYCPGFDTKVGIDRIINEDDTSIIDINDSFALPSDDKYTAEFNKLTALLGMFQNGFRAVAAAT